MSRSWDSSAIVIGAGVAGLMTARVLSDHVDRVLILERDRLPDNAVARRNVPQGRHAHILLAVGHRLLAGWFPGLTDDLVLGGAVPLRDSERVWHQDGVFQIGPGLGLLTLSTSQPLLEATIRRRLLKQRPNVSISEETAVDGLVLDHDRVIGVRVDGGQRRAGLVVACSGRHTPFLEHLAQRGFARPQVSAVQIDVAYGTRTVPRRPGDLDGASTAVVHGPPPGHRMGIILPAEGGRWTITLGSSHGDVPPTGPAAYEDFARSLPSPLIADILAQATTPTPVLTHQVPSGQRRHVERLRRTPAGFLVLGDAICSLNPVHAQGISSAALQAQALHRAVAGHGPNAPTLTHAFYRRAATVVDTAWRTAAKAPPAADRRWSADERPPIAGSHSARKASICDRNSGQADSDAVRR